MNEPMTLANTPLFYKGEPSELKSRETKEIIADIDTLEAFHREMHVSENAQDGKHKILLDFHNYAHRLLVENQELKVELSRFKPLIGVLKDPTQ